MADPILYSFRRCPYAMRARLALRASGTAVRLREIVLRDKAPEFLAVSPKGTVPVLQLSDGTVLEESFDIMLWAEGQSDPTGLLAEGGAAAKALVQACDAEFKPWLDRYKYPSRFDDFPRGSARAKAGLFLDGLEARLAQNQFLFGSVRGFADIGIAPFVRQFAHVDKDWFLASEWSHIVRWYLEFVEWGGFQAVMQKYPKWQMGDPDQLFGV